MQSEDAAKVGLALLRKPFPPHLISKRQVMKGGPMLDYVGHAALTDRLLDADPQWAWEPLAYAQSGLPYIDELGGMWIKLTVCGVTRIGYGDAQGKTGPNAIKEVIGDALRNAAMRFGAALDLWHKGDLHADEEPPKGPPPGSGADVKKQAFDALQPEIQEYLRKSVPSICAAASEDPKRAIELAGMTLDNWPDEDRNELKKALWHLLDSKTRTAIDNVQKR